MRFMQLAKVFHETPWQPAADIYAYPDGWLVKFDLSGVPPEEVEVSVQGRYLLVNGARRDWVCQADHRCYSMEISYNRFHRAVELPCDLEGAKVSLDYRYGMLLVRLSTGK